MVKFFIHYTRSTDLQHDRIFDFGDWFVVEFFRGLGTETRIFPRNIQIEQILFSSSSLSIRQLRCLGGELHDHKYLWQFYCEQWLQDKGIHPNPGAQPRRVPTEEKKREREWQLRRWRRDIERINMEASNYKH